MKRMRGILHATDFSRASSRAFASALDLAQRQRAQLLLLHVMAPPSPFRASEPPTDSLALLAETRRDAQRRLRALLARARKRGVRARSKLSGSSPFSKRRRFPCIRSLAPVPLARARAGCECLRTAAADVPHLGCERPSQRRMAPSLPGDKRLESSRFRDAEKRWPAGTVNARFQACANSRRRKGGRLLRPEARERIAAPRG